MFRVDDEVIDWVPILKDKDFVAKEIKNPLTKYEFRERFEKFFRSEIERFKIDMEEPQENFV